jgi:protein dithiol:quinone oxidoreductase
MNRRLPFALPVVICAALLGYGYFLQYAQGLEPCPLCMVQRFFFYLVAGVCLVAAIHAPARTGSILYGSLAALIALGGAAAAGRQVWLQHLPADKVPQCGPDLMYMLNNLPLSRTLEKLFYGSGECAKVDWTFLGLSIAEWSLLWFIALVLYALWLAARRPRPR